MSSASSPLCTKWYWIPWRVVTRRVPLPSRAGDVVEGEVLLAGQGAAGDAGPHHADVVDVLPCPLALAPHVAVVLLVDAVELEQHAAVAPRTTGTRPPARPPACRAGRGSRP